MSLAETLATLVDIPSVTGNEGRLCTHLAERLMPYWGPNAVQRVGNSLVVGFLTGRPLIALFGHIDTVPRQGQGPARVEGGRLHGLGAADMKAGLAVMVHLLEDASVRNGPFDVVGVFYEREEGPMEENGLEDVLQRVSWLTDTELGLVLEPTGLAIELGCQGVVNARAVFTGRSAHSARPWLGANAVTGAGEWLTALHQRAPHDVEVGGLSFREVVTVTMAQGGLARNIVPDRFECTVNYRFAPDKTVDEAFGQLREILAGPDEIEILDTAPPAPVAVSNRHVTRLADCAQTVFRAKQGWTDVARLAEWGIQAVNFGPGETEQAHTVDESVPLENVEMAYDCLWRALTSDR